MVDRDERRARRPAARPVRGRAGWRAAARAAPSPPRRRSTARAWSASKAPRSQNTSTHRACGAQASSIGAGHQVDVLRRVVGVLLGHDVRAEERRLLGELPRHRQAARLVVDGQPVAALDLHRGGALPAHLVDQPGDVRGELLVGRGAGRGDGGADAAGGVRRPGHPGGELLGAVAGEHQVRVRVDEPRDHRPPAQVVRRVGRRARSRPGRSTRRGPTRRRARRRAARPDPWAGSCVVSSPIPVSSRVVTVPTPS